MNRLFIEQNIAVNIKSQKEWKEFCEIVLKEYRVCDLNSNWQNWGAYGIVREDGPLNMIQGLGSSLPRKSIVSFQEFKKMLQGLDSDADKISGLEDVL